MKARLKRVIHRNTMLLGHADAGDQTYIRGFDTMLATGRIVQRYPDSVSGEIPRNLQHAADVLAMMPTDCHTDSAPYAFIVGRVAP